MIYPLRFQLAFLLLLFASNLSITNQAFAEEHREFKNFCMWKASAAQTIAMNRDLGVNEIKIIDLYLNQNTDYNEQVLVLHLIDKIYGNYKYVTLDTIYAQTNDSCLRDMYIDRTSEFYLSQQIDEYH